MSNREAVRLVIWDLDETFWRGTLSEGGIQEYIRDHHNIVIELAKRGIISSICSKNDYATVEKILKEHGIWDYFIFPSIDWAPKGPRLKELINDIQLRPETILFIDDNAGNRAEAEMHVPGLQVADEAIIPTLLNHELCKGKEDANLTRLKQYQVLQRRKIDEKAAGSNNIAFLHSSNIRVAIEPNIEAHLDRAIELINRTNQLNFTKIRLPDDMEEAKKELLRLANRYYNQAGLVYVWDNYGNYGFCGLYITLTVHDIKRLVHFCFSCRILGMGVERWLYQKLGKPQIQIQGEVLADLYAEEVNWINTDIGGNLLFSEGIEDAPLPVSGEILQSIAPEIRLRGGCELDALSHYLRQETPSLISHTNYVKGAFILRQDATPNIALSFSPLDETIQHEIDTLALDRKNFEGHIFAAPQPGTLFIISTWGDLYLPVYRHNVLGFEIGVALTVGGVGVHDLTKATPANLENYFNQYSFTEEKREQVKRIAQHLAANYTYIGITNEVALCRNWKMIFERIPKNCQLAVLLPSCHRGDATSWALRYHAIVREVARNFPHIFTVDVTPYIKRNEDVQDALDHLDRMVYFNIYKDLMQEFGKRLSPVSNQRLNLLENTLLA